MKFIERLDVAANASVEYILPDELGETVTLELSVELPYRDTLKFINQLLTPELKPKMLIKLRGCKIRITDPMEEKLEIEYDDKEPVIEPNPVSLVLTCEVIDFDVSKRKDFGSQTSKTR